MKIAFWTILSLLAAAAIWAAVEPREADITLEAYEHIAPDEHAERFCHADGGVAGVFQDEQGRHRFVVCAGGSVSGRYDLKP
jgi:hypothetical protein